MGVSFPDGFSWCSCCSLSWILLWSIPGNWKQRGFRVKGQAVRGSCTGWAEGGGDNPLPGAALLVLLSTFLIHPLRNNQPGKQSRVLALGTSTYLKTQIFFKLLQQFPSSPLSGPTAKHMARPFICFNYSCVVEWHLWIIGNVRPQQLFSYTPAALPQAL